MFNWKLLNCLSNDNQYLVPKLIWLVEVKKFTFVIIKWNTKKFYMQNFQMQFYTESILQNACALCSRKSIDTIMCRNAELSLTMSWVCCLLKYSELFILFAENRQILLKISVIPILLIFIYLVVLYLLVNNHINSSSNSTHHCGT